MSRKSLVLALLALPLAASVASAQSSRDYIAVVGSSTVYPFTTTVAEQFGKGGKFKTPKVESTGTGGGFKLFCSGVGVQYPDVTNASRAIKPAELDTCTKAGVKDLIELVARSLVDKDRLDALVFVEANPYTFGSLLRNEP